MEGYEESELKKKEEDNNDIVCYVKWITSIIRTDDVLKVKWEDIEIEKSKKRQLKIKEREEISQWKSLYNIKSIKSWTNKNEIKDDLENDNSLSSCSVSEIGSEGEEEVSTNEVKKIIKKNIDYTALSRYIKEGSFSDEGEKDKNEGRDRDLISYNIFKEIINQNNELDMIFFHNLNMHRNNDKEVKENIKNEQNGVIDRSAKNDLEKESNNKIVENKLINNIKNENLNNSLNLKLESDFDPSKRMENNNFCFWNMENETCITRPLYANQLNKKSYTLLDESEEMIKQFSSNQYSIKFVPRHLLYSVSQVASRTFFDPLYRKQLFF
ncbi:hypothetical protein YYE_04592 [Plasmodium vinckei vinckei]|uniref:Uncharacterized protein n=1 Tax=Plasmodium vinckei vinckei TaxID=54757 RepID=A0A081I9Q1_PLAVN|nr:hypothetical protein YYE_04592 [Plasmodium vinckei vinckei]